MFVSILTVAIIGAIWSFHLDYKIKQAYKLGYEAGRESNE